MTSADQEQDAADILAAIMRDGHQQADMVGAFLEAVGFLPPAPKRKGKTFYLPADLLLKIAALTRLYQLDCADLGGQLPESLPNWEAVYEDLTEQTLGNECRFSGQQLITDLMKVSIQRLCWRPLDNRSAIAVSQTLEPDALLEEIAQLLWEHRHLGRQANEQVDEATDKV